MPKVKIRGRSPASLPHPCIEANYELDHTTQQSEHLSLPLVIRKKREAKGQILNWVGTEFEIPKPNSLLIWPIYTIEETRLYIFFILELNGKLQENLDFWSKHFSCIIFIYHCRSVCVHVNFYTEMV